MTAVDKNLVQHTRNFSSTSTNILGANGPLARKLPGFVVRPVQQDMAARIETALGHAGTFIGESGTGTGKTFAYLVPALQSRKKVLISSGTKNLQEQIFKRDLPLVRDALELPVTVALLKGRANYLCLYRLERSQTDHRTQARKEDAYLARVQEWARRTRRGDIAEMTEIPEDADIWPLVTSNADNCLGSHCPRYNECHVNRARREALKADVVVINHHLFFADLVLREEGFGELLPGVDAVIFDEAHQLPEIATSFFGVMLSSHQIVGLCRDTIAEDVRERSGIADLQEQARKVEKATADLRLAFGAEPRRDTWRAVEGQRGLREALAALRERLAALAAQLEVAAGKGEGLANCSQRASELLGRLYTMADTPPPEYVLWFETSPRGFSLRLTALDVASSLREHLQADRKTWIFISATLTIDKSFEHYQTQMGLELADTGRWDSPFNYENQALLYIPPDLPNPADPDYTRLVVESALPVLEASRGRAFLLFTSYRALNIAAEMLPSLTSYPLLVQGSAPRTELLERFRALGQAVLLGTGSFWEGVDVRGDTLSCVIIDKLPFAAPDDPVLRARAEAMERAGRKPFLEYQLPSAVIALKQGAGRLIRDEKDRGVLVLCDPRLLSRGYGRVFLNSLPAMPLTRSIDDVKAFFGPPPGE
ncbi:MAG: ATP-dependent DNA helicase [Acidiferrobacterales bacterium]|nr:ATP-dependent DNA helicase [Gammaproteobacteria bacterium]